MFKNSMNSPLYKYIFIVLFFVLILPTFGQEKELNYEVNLSSGLSSATTLPFWLASNRFGTVPDSDHVLLNTSVFSDFNKPDQFFDFSYKASGTGYIAKTNEALINELYFAVRLKWFTIDMGSKNDAVLWNNLSSSNGNIFKSNNARAMPGFNIKIADYLAVPFGFTKKWLSFKGNFAHYFLNDNRAVDNAYLHAKSLYFKIKLSSKFEAIGGVDHYAQWAGESEDWGKQASTFKDYLRILSGYAGGESALETDRKNALGNHLGNYLFQFNYYGDQTNLNLYYSHPFEDASGREFANIQDGLYGLFVDFKKEKALVRSVLGEFTYTKNMSGSTHLVKNADDTESFGRGKDNYLNNGVYASGWTYYGKAIGSPYFTTKPKDENGITNGVIVGDNRFMAFNIGVNGDVGLLAYKAMLSHTTYFGWFENEYDPYPTQFSGLLEVVLPQSELKLPFEISASASFDTGTYRPVNFGGFLSIRKRGVF